MQSTGRRSLFMEIYEHIIDYFQDDLDTLASCSLTTRAWLPYVRRYLLRRVVVKNGEQYRKFLSTSKKSPGFSNNIRTLRLTKTHTRDSILDRDWPILLPRLIKMQELVIENLNTRAMSEKAWETLSTRPSSIRILRLRGLRIAPRTLMALTGAFPSLSEIHLDDVRCLPDNNAMSATVAALAFPGPDLLTGTVDSLDIVDCSDSVAVHLSHCPIKFRLERLLLGNSDLHVGQAVPMTQTLLLQAGAPTLRHLVLTTSFGSEILPNILIQDRNPTATGGIAVLHLKSRSIHDGEHLGPRSPPAIQWMSRALLPLAASRSRLYLQQLIFSFHEHDLLLGCPRNLWEYLDNYCFAISYDNPGISFTINIFSDSAVRKWVRSIAGPVGLRLEMLRFNKCTVTLRHGLAWDENLGFGGELAGHVEEFVYRFARQRPIRVAPVRS